MEETEKKTSEKRIVTPLWVIGLFISLTEVVLGVAVTQTTGGIQVALTVFIIVFALLVAAAFFATLWNRPLVLYAPKDYGPQIDVREFVQAVQYRPPSQIDTSQEIENRIRDALESSESLAGLAEEQIGRVIDEINKDLFLTVDSRPLYGSRGQVWRVLYDRYTNVTELLKDIERAIAGPVMFPFGSEWILRDGDTGHRFEPKEMGSGWAAKHRTGGLDWRRLDAVGITPGMILEVVPVGGRSFPPQRKAV